jgi:hypothetical protein
MAGVCGRFWVIPAIEFFVKLDGLPLGQSLDSVGIAPRYLFLSAEWSPDSLYRVCDFGFHPLLLLL